MKDLVQKYKEQVPEACTTISGWELTGTLREFPPMEPVRMWFDYPFHRVDEWNFLAVAKYSESGQRGIGKEQSTKEDIADALEDLFNTECIEVNGALERESVKDATGLSDTNLNKHTRPNTNFECGTLQDGTKVVFRRGHEMILFKNRVYQRPKSKNKPWYE